MVASLPFVPGWGNGYSVHVRGKPRPGCAGQTGQSGGVVWQRSRQDSARAAGRSPRPWCPAPGGCDAALRDDEGPARPSFAANDRDGRPPHASGPRCARRPVKPGPREPHGRLADFTALRLQQLPACARGRWAVRRERNGRTEKLCARITRAGGKALCDPGRSRTAKSVTGEAPLALHGGRLGRCPAGCESSQGYRLRRHRGTPKKKLTKW